MNKWITLFCILRFRVFVLSFAFALAEITNGFKGKSVLNQVSQSKTIICESRSRYFIRRSSQIGSEWFSEPKNKKIKKRKKKLRMISHYVGSKYASLTFNFQGWKEKGLRVPPKRNITFKLQYGNVRKSHMNMMYISQRRFTS